MEIQIRPSFRTKIIFIIVTILYLIFVLMGGYNQYIDRIENDNIVFIINVFLIISGLLWVSLSIHVITQLITYSDHQLSTRTFFSKSSFLLQDVISVKLEIESWIARITLVNINNQKYRCVAIFTPKDKLREITKMIENTIKPITSVE